MNSVTIGKYIPGNSIIYKLDPRIKLIFNIVYIVLVFLTNNFVVLGALWSIAVFAYLLSGLRKWQLLRIIIPVMFIGVFIFAINLVLIQPTDQQPLNDLWTAKNYSWWKFTLSDEALMRTLLVMVRIYIMILVTTLLTATTKPIALTRALEDIMLPLKLIKVPVHIIAMIISIALRFIPTLLSEAQRIMKSQASRGVDFKNGNYKAKVKSLVTLIIPLFISAFAKADDLGNAMETRGYDPYAKRTKYKQYNMGIKDYIFALLIVGLIVAIALLVHQVYTLPNWK